MLNFDRSTVKHALQNTQNDCHQWLSHSLRVHQIRFRPGLRPGPCWGSLQRSPRPLTWFKRTLLLRGERDGPLTEFPGSAPAYVVWGCCNVRVQLIVCVFAVWIMSHLSALIYALITTTNTSCICGEGSVKRSGVRLSVCLIDRQQQWRPVGPIRCWCEWIFDAVFTFLFLSLYTHAHTYTFNGLFRVCPGEPVPERKTQSGFYWKQDTVSDSGIRCAACKSAPRSRQITMPAPHHSDFYRPDALPVAQPAASKRWRQISQSVLVFC